MLDTIPTAFCSPYVYVEPGYYGAWYVRSDGVVDGNLVRNSYGNYISPGTSNIDSGDYVWNIDSNGEINGDIYIEDSYGTLRILNYFIHHILCIT